MTVHSSHGCRELIIKVYKNTYSINAAVYLGLAQNGNTLYNENKNAVK